jgi:hypothetical protein
MASVVLSDRALMEPPIAFVAIIWLGEGEKWLVLVLIYIMHLICLKYCYKWVLARSNLIHIRGLHNGLRNSIIELILRSSTFARAACASSLFEVDWTFLKSVLLNRWARNAPISSCIVSGYTFLGKFSCSLPAGTTLPPVSLHRRRHLIPCNWRIDLVKHHFFLKCPYFLRLVGLLSWGLRCLEA